MRQFLLYPSEVKKTLPRAWGFYSFFYFTLAMFRSVSELFPGGASLATLTESVTQDSSRMGRRTDRKQFTGPERTLSPAGATDPSLSDSRAISAGIGINFVILIVFLIAVVVAAIYSFKFNTLLGDAEALGVAPPHVLKMCADIMVPTWLFIMTPFVNVGLASGLAVTVSHLQKQIQAARNT